MSDTTIGIIGAGIGGIAAAVCLRRVGIRAVVFERREYLREDGAGLSLWPNGTCVLDRLGLLSRVSAAGQQGTIFRLLTSLGKPLMSIDTAHADTPSICLHRADLLRILAEQVPETDLRPQHELLRIQTINKKLELLFRNGRKFSCDGVVGADGIYSQMRALLPGSAAPQDRGYVIFRAIVDVPDTFVPGHNSESWGSGRRFGMLSIAQDKVCWYATSNAFDTELTGERRKSEIWRMFRGWHRPIQDLVSRTEASAILMSIARDLRPFRRWGTGSTTLLGDAAHALTPNLGQGACMALEDAFVLATCLSAYKSVPVAFRIYESLRFQRTRSAILRSRYLGWIGQWENRLAVPLRNAVTGLLPGRLFECHAKSTEFLASITGRLCMNLQSCTQG